MNRSAKGGNSVKRSELDSVADPIKIKAFSAIGSHDFDRQLCPVRAMLQYRETTSSPGCRKGRKKLFLSYKPSKTDEIKRPTISSWIVKLIHQDYATEGSNPCALELHNVSAHEVRALSASASIFRGMTQSCRHVLGELEAHSQTFTSDICALS